MKKIFEGNVRRDAHADIVGTFRCGTAIADYERLVALFGTPAFVGDREADKFSAEWVFVTPRGVVTLYDYWWNGEGEWSIGAQNQQASLWLVGYLRGQGFRAKNDTCFR